MIAKNNIFNIRAGQNWQGRTGVRKGFVEFMNKEYAIRAWLLLMRTYRRRGLRRIGDGSDDPLSKGNGITQ